MNEKIIIQTKKANVLPACVALVAIGVVIGLIYSVNYSLFRGFNNYYWTSILPYCLAICALPLLGIALIIYLANLSELTVTNKRIYGKAAFGRRVDLPIDSVSAVATGLFWSISVSTSSGRITFLGLVNRDDIHKAISNLLVDRQNKAGVPVIKQEVAQSNADELKKYKDLLDSGIITQAEFDAKKKDLLGL